MEADRPRNLQILPRFGDGLSYLYVERVRVDRHDQAVAAWDEQGIIPIPCASLAALMLGPGTTITHMAVRTLADHGCSIVWVGESGVRFYGAGTGETRHARYLERQAQLWADPRSRMTVARHLYQRRFPDEDVSSLTLQQLRGKEGVRVKRAYQAASKATGVAWSSRSYRRDDWAAGDTVNRALSAGNACLYGLFHAGIASLGCSPGLGFIHAGKQLSFVYDLADLYKAETTIPTAFAVTAEGVIDIDRRTRLACRDVFHKSKLLEQIVMDLHQLFGAAIEDVGFEEYAAQPGGLWDPDTTYAAGGTNYAEEE